MTGVSGLIGSAVVRLLEHDHEIVKVGRRDGDDVVLDLSDESTWDRADFPQIDALVHCAGVVDEDIRDHADLAWKKAVGGANRLVDAALHAGARHLVYISSAHVYGPLVGRVDESRASNPVSDYAIAHYATEQIFRRRASDQVRVSALRPCAVFGLLPDPERFRRWSLVPFAVPRDAVSGGEIRIRSSGEQRRNFVGNDDIARVVARWLGEDGQGWSVLNPIGLLDASIAEVAQICAEEAESVTGRPCQVFRGGPDVDPPEPLRYESTASYERGSQSFRATTRDLLRLLNGGA